MLSLITPFPHLVQVHALRSFRSVISDMPLCAFPVLGVGDVADTKRVDGDDSMGKDPSGR